MQEAAPTAAAGEQRPELGRSSAAHYGSVPAAGSLEDLQHRAHLRSGLDRKRSAKLLFVGTLAGFLGFFFAFLIGVIKSESYDKYDLNGKAFASGKAYFPSTVSEMVSNPSEPGGKCFYCFEFTGALILFFSYYPTMLRNVYVGDDVEVPYIKISWETFRQFVPAPGMMLLAIIPTVPVAKADTLDQFCIQLHLIGAVMLFIGYFLAEAYAVGWGPFKEPGCPSLVESQGQTRELSLRKWCLNGILFWYVVFTLLQTLFLIPLPFPPADHFDQWGHLVKARTATAGKFHKGVQLINTAHFDVKTMKVISYLSEVFCGMCMLASHWVVWYYCEERNYDLAEELPSFKDQHAELSPELKGRLSPNDV